MKKLLVVLLVLALGLVVAAVAKEGAGKTVNGWLVDSKCGAKMANAKGEDCVKKCLAAGAKLAFVPDGTQDVLIVDNPDSLKGHEGHHVTLTGSTDMDKKTIHVDSFKMVAEKAAPGGETKH